MDEMRAFCDQLAAEAKQNSSAGNVGEAVKAFIALYGGNTTARLLPRSDVEKTSRSLARRNDVRVQPYLGVNTCTSLAPGANIFADSRLHVHAAASLAALAQRRVHFDSTMPTSEVRILLQAYISEFTSAPHWIFVGSSSSPVIHDATNPREFTRRLIANIVDHLQAAVATEGITDAANSVNLLASTLSTSSSDVSDTLYAAIGILREGTDAGPVFYSISFTSLRMSHERYRKSRPLAGEGQTVTVVLKLDSPMLVEHESLYSQLPGSSVDDWFHGLTI